METNKPTAKYRRGTVCISRWTNRNKDNEEFDSYSLDINFFDKETGTYKPAKSISERQLMQLRSCIDKALNDTVSDK